MKQCLLILLFCSVVTVMSACGQSGHLYLPPDTTNAAK
jgi:predicted small lipoprotein YifL